MDNEYNVIVQHTGDGITVSEPYIIGPDFSTVEQAKQYATDEVVGPKENGFCAYCWIGKYEGFIDGKPSFVEVESLW